MFGKKKEEVTVREYARSDDSVAPIPGNRPVNDWPSMKIDAGRKNDQIPKQEQQVMQPPSFSKPPAPVSGQTAPGNTGGSGDRAKKKQTMKTVGIIMVFTVAVFGYLAYEIMGMRGGGSSEPPKTQEGSVTAQEDIRLMQEKKELAEKLALMTNQRDEALSQIEQRIDEKLRAYEEANAGMAGSELGDKLTIITESQAKLQEQIAAMQKSREEEERKPMEGSAAPTIAYNRLKEIADARKADEKALAEQAAVAPPYDIRAGLQAGSIIPATLRTTMVSSMLLDRFFVVAETTEPYEIMPGYVLPAGVRFLGKPTADMEARRMLVDVNKMQYGSTELDLKGCMLDYRGNPGLVTKYIDPLNQAIFPVLLTSLASATAAAMQDMTTYHNSVTGDSYERPTFNAENAVLQGTSNALSNVSSIMLQAQMRKQPTIIVKAGIPVQIQISEKLVLDSLVDTGIVKPTR